MAPTTQVKQMTSKTCPRDSTSSVHEDMRMRFNANTCRLYKHSLTGSDLKNHDEKIKARNRRMLKELKYAKSISLTRPSYNKWYN